MGHVLHFGEIAHKRVHYYYYYLVGVSEASAHEEVSRSRGSGAETADPTAGGPGGQGTAVGSRASVLSLCLGVRIQE